MKMRPVELEEIGADLFFVLRRGQAPELEAARNIVGLAPGLVAGEWVVGVLVRDPDSIDEGPQRIHRLLLSDPMDQKHGLLLSSPALLVLPLSQDVWLLQSYRVALDAWFHLHHLGYVAGACPLFSRDAYPMDTRRDVFYRNLL